MFTLRMPAVARGGNVSIQLEAAGGGRTVFPVDTRRHGGPYACVRPGWGMPAAAGKEITIHPNIATRSRHT